MKIRGGIPVLVLELFPLLFLFGGRALGQVERVCLEVNKPGKKRRARLPFSGSDKFGLGVYLVPGNKYPEVELSYSVKKVNAKGASRSEDRYQVVCPGLRVPADFWSFGKEDGTSFVLICGNDGAGIGEIHCYRREIGEPEYSRVWRVKEKGTDFVGVKYLVVQKCVVALRIDGSIEVFPWDFRSQGQPGEGKIVIKGNLVHQLVNFPISEAFLSLCRFYGREDASFKKRRLPYGGVGIFVRIERMGGRIPYTSNKLFYFHFQRDGGILFFVEPNFTFEDPFKYKIPVFSEESSLALSNGINPRNWVLLFDCSEYPFDLLARREKGKKSKNLQIRGKFEIGKTYLLTLGGGSRVLDGFYLVPRIGLGAKGVEKARRGKSSLFNQFFRTLEVGGDLAPPVIPLKGKDFLGGAKCVLVLAIQENRNGPKVVRWNGFSVLSPDAWCVLKESNLSSKGVTVVEITDLVCFDGPWKVPQKDVFSGLLLWGQWIVVLEDGRIQVTAPVGGIIRKRGNHANGGVGFDVVYKAVNPRFDDKSINAGKKLLWGLPGFSKGSGKNNVETMMKRLLGNCDK